MSRQIWQIPTETTTHTVTYAFHRLTGRMKVTVNGDAFTIPGGFLGLRAARREPFRLVGEDGEAEQAILVVDKRGRATLLFRAKAVPEEGSEGR